MSAIEELAARCGLEAEFLDARGETRETSPETRRALLVAMGFDANNEAAAQAELAKLDRLEWERALAPVHVLQRSERPLCVALTLLATVETNVVWHLRLEDGIEETGNAFFANFTLLERKQVNGLMRERRQFVLKNDIPFGYHRLAIEGGGETILIVTPGKCWLPASIENGRRVWGVAAQLYLLRSAKDWGIGDFGDLRRLVEMFAARGADIVGLNPLHAMFFDRPEHASPYSPESRLLLNVLNIDVESVPELAISPEAQALITSEPFRQALQHSRAAQLVDYASVSKLKMAALRLIFESSSRDRTTGRWRAFEIFRRKMGEVSELGYLFEALCTHFAGTPLQSTDWHAWPREYRDPRSEAVFRFAKENADQITFRAWLQFNADSQLGDAALAAKGMDIGLYRDLAVGADPSGAETWANQRAVVDAVETGAPPDIYNPAGQSWGLPPFNPHTLYEEAYRSFIDLVRANMRHAGGLRIDHVMALQHLYWIPKGMSPAEGAYVSYPLSDLSGILALESHRNHCVVIGEDLGTVPDGFRDRMAKANILSYRVLFFEKDESEFLQPDFYPELALAVAGSHDLPTLSGWWAARDIQLKESLNLFPAPDDIQRARQERDQDRMQLIAALKREGFDIGERDIDVEELVFAAHAYLARSRSALVMLQIDDITGEMDPVNIPSTSNDYPNWRRRLSLTLEDLENHRRLDALTGLFQRERGG